MPLANFSSAFKPGSVTVLAAILMPTRQVITKVTFVLKSRTRPRR